mgnify:CR=1 FL=1
MEWQRLIANGNVFNRAKPHFRLPDCANHRQPETFANPSRSGIYARRCYVVAYKINVPVLVGHKCPTYSHYALTPFQPALRCKNAGANAWAA